MSELNKVMGNGHFYVKSRREPAGIFAWNVYPLAFLWVAGASIAVYARFIKGYNNLWLIAGFVPMWTYGLYNYARQPTGQIENCYNYLLAKRAATCELEANAKRFAQNDFTQTEAFGKLRGALEARNVTLYQVEAELVDKIVAGSFK